MNINTLISQIRDAIATDIEIKSWCQSTYGKDHKVFIGTDMRREPEQSDYPVVKIFPSEKTEGHYISEMDHIINVICGIHQEAIINQNNIIELKGINEIETFRAKVRDVIVSTMINNGANVSKLTTIYETIEYFPFFLVGMNIEIQTNIPIGGNYFD